jgi:ELWxxDGT repeat protein
LSLLSLLSLGSLAVPAFGLEPYLVKDINPVRAVTGSMPADFVSLGGAAVFTAFDGESGFGLWRSDGTAAGTWKLADVCPAGPSSCGRAQALAVVAGRAFLALGLDLWITDGTVAGTLRLTDGVLGVSPEAAAWVPEQRVLYFLATDQAHGSELWRSDGTPAGTHLVADLVRGPQSPQIRTLTAFRGRVWFGAWIRPRGSSLWRSDGTERGTVPVLETDRPGLPILYGVVGKRLLFSGLFGKKGAELWATDGTPRGTGALRRGVPYDASVQNGRLFFVADTPGRGQELWVSDGTVRGTRVVSDIPGKEAFFNTTIGYQLYLPRTSIPGRFLFQAWDPVHGVELWASDGTPAGTRLLRDVCPGPCLGADHVLATNQGLFYFAGRDGAHGLELWASDGTPAGTRMVRDIAPGSDSSTPYLPARFAGRLLFAANDGVNGWELWATDGSGPGTVRLTDLAIFDPPYSFNGVGVTAGAPAVARFLFAAYDGEHDVELWSTDGRPGGAALVADINQADFGGSVISGIRALGDQAVFFADDGLHGHELWKSDGTAAGTDLIAELWPASEPQGPPAVLASAETGGMLFLLLAGDGYSLVRTDGTAAGTLRLRGPEDNPRLWDGSSPTAVGGTVFFTVFNGDLGLQLWSTDGTVAGTRQVVDSGPGKAFANPNGLAELGGRLYFFATGPDGSYGLWRSDGTAATPPNTAQVRSFGAPFGAVPLPTVHAGRLWFFAAAPAGVELWSSDGTAAGTRIELLPGIPRQAGFMASIGAKLMISGYAQGRGFELWATDGTPEGTVKVGPPLYNNFVPGISWTVFQGRLVYSVDERFEGYPKLWTSDGTPAGTGPLLDRDGKLIPAPIGMAVLGDRLIFTTATPAQVWESDGTPDGTGPLAPERPIGYNPGAVGRAGSRVFFAAWDPATGQELWAVEEGHP